MLQVLFYCTDQGVEPVKVWLRGLCEVDRGRISADIKLVQLGWPLGMPLVSHVRAQIWEIRTKLQRSNMIARVLFTIVDKKLILLCGFIKKTRKTPKRMIELAIKRKREVIYHGK